VKRTDILAALAAGVPTIGPRTIHVDVTNACHAVEVDA
jgi:hypothetical protein